MTDAAHAQAPTSAFGEEAARVLNRLQKSTNQVVHSLADTTGDSSADIAASLDIDPKLAWKISKILRGSDVLSTARFVPGTAGYQIFLRAAAQKRVSKGVIAAAQAAFDSFNDLIRTHAGNRRAFDMMLAGHVREGRDQAEIDHRRQLFEGMSYVWGVQARVALRVDVMGPSAAADMFDCATIRGFVDLRRIRPHVPWRISRAYSADAGGNIHTEFSREPIETGSSADRALDDLPLMPSFCSRPLPECRRVDGPGGIEYELVEGAVGNTGVLTCVMGEIVRRAEPRFRNPDYPDFSQMFRMRTPSELAMFDVLIHRSLFGRRLHPEAILYSDLFANQLGPRYRECDRLQLGASLEYLGTGSAVAANRHVERYPELIQCALSRAGWNGAEFDVYRLLLRYPPVPSNLMITHELPEAPRV